MTGNNHEAKKRFSKLSSRARSPKQRPLGTERGKIWMAPDFDELKQDLLQAFYGGRLPEVEHPPKAPKRAKRRR